MARQQRQVHCSRLRQYETEAVARSLAVRPWWARSCLLTGQAYSKSCVAVVQSPTRLVVVVYLHQQAVASREGAGASQSWVRCPLLLRPC